MYVCIYTHELEITVGISRKFPISGELKVVRSNGVLSDEFANFRDGIVSGPMEIVQPPTDQEIRDHSLRVETRREWQDEGRN